MCRHGRALPLLSTDTCAKPNLPTRKPQEQHSPRSHWSDHYLYLQSLLLYAFVIKQNVLSRLRVRYVVSRKITASKWAMTFMILEKLKCLYLYSTCLHLTPIMQSSEQLLTLTYPNNRTPTNFSIFRLCDSRYPYVANRACRFSKITQNVLMGCFIKLNRLVFFFIIPLFLNYNAERF